MGVPFFSHSFETSTWDSVEIYYFVNTIQIGMEKKTEVIFLVLSSNHTDNLF